MCERVSPFYSWTCNCKSRTKQSPHKRISVKLTKLRLSTASPRSSCLQAQQVWTRRTLPSDLEREIGQEEDAINILLGNYPNGVRRGLNLVDQELPPEVPPGLTSSLLKRRPDIRKRSRS